jgi:hypothetical protein
LVKNETSKTQDHQSPGKMNVISHERFEAWSIGGAESIMYTRDYGFAKFVASEIGGWGASYHNSHGPFAWHFVMKTKLISLLKAKYSRTRPLNSNKLQVSNGTNLAQEERKSLSGYQTPSPVPAH